MSYQLVEYIKKNTEFKSDYEISKALNLDRRIISNWKNQGKTANGETMLKLVKLSGLTIDQALKIIQHDASMYIMLNSETIKKKLFKLVINSIFVQSFQAKSFY